MLPVLGGAEEQVERLREDQRVLVARDEDRFKRGIDIGAVADLDHLQRIHRIDDRAGADRNPGGTQRPGKADHVVGDQPGGGSGGGRGHLRFPNAASFRDAPFGADPESITTIGSMDSGFTLGGAAPE